MKLGRLYHIKKAAATAPLQKAFYTSLEHKKMQKNLRIQKKRCLQFAGGYYIIIKMQKSSIIKEVRLIAYVQCVKFWVRFLWKFPC